MTRVTHQGDSMSRHGYFDQYILRWNIRSYHQSTIRVGVSTIEHFHEADVESCFDKVVCIMLCILNKQSISLKPTDSPLV